MPATPLFHPEAALGKATGRLGRLTKKEASTLATLKQLVRKQGLSLGLVRGPGEQNDVCLLRFLRAQGFEEKRALAALVSCVDWGASVGLSDLRGHLGAGAAPPESLVRKGIEGLATVSTGRDRQGRPLAIIRLGRLTESLVVACGRKALLRYLVWAVERMLERVAASMLATQFIIEGVSVVCDAKGWDQENVGDSVLSLLQEAAELGLSYYPERLGHLFIVNVAASDAGHLRLAARALGLTAAVDSGRLRILPGDLPKWAPELRKAISPENLPVEYGGTAAALPVPSPAQSFPGDPNHGMSAKGMNNAPSGSKLSVANSSLWKKLEQALSGAGSSTTYTISGRQAISLTLSLWALFRKSAAAGATALWAIAVALSAREWVSGPVTLPSARYKVPLLHDFSVLRTENIEAGAREAEYRGDASTKERTDSTPVVESDFGRGQTVRGVVDSGGSSAGGVPGVTDSSGDAWEDWDGARGVPASLLGARVEVMEWVGSGQSGFDRFCVKVQMPGISSDGRGVPAVERREWVTWRRLTEFAALRVSLMQEACPGAAGSDKDPRIWKLPPTVPFNVLAPRLGGYLQQLIDEGVSSDREQLRSFLGCNVYSSGVKQPTQTTNPAMPPPPPSNPAFGVGSGNGRRMTAPPIMAAPVDSLPLLVVSAGTPMIPELSRSRETSWSSAGVESGIGGSGSGAVADSESDLIEVDRREAIILGGVLREIPSLRPELEAMFQDPGECHTLKLPEKEHNQWLRRAHRAAAQYPSNSTHSAPGGSTAAAAVGAGSSPHTRRPSFSHSNSARNMGSNATGSGGHALPPTPPPLVIPTPYAGGSREQVYVSPPPTGFQPAAPWSPRASDGKRSGVTSPLRRQDRSKSPKRADGRPSPRKREALKRFVSMVKRKGSNGKHHHHHHRHHHGGGGIMFPPGSETWSIFRLLHVDIFQVPPGNHLHRVDHIVGLEGGLAQARVKELTTKVEQEGDGPTFVFVVNLQLPRSFTKKNWAASVVLYWGVPMDALAGSFHSPTHAPANTFRTPSPEFSSSPSPSPGTPSPPPNHNLPPFERELLKRYIDLPFNRRRGSAHGAASPSEFVTHEASAVTGKGAAAGSAVLHGFPAMDEDENESGVFSDKDFRNMSLKVVTSVVEGRWTVRKAVDDGSSQVLSRKLTQRYFRGSMYMETDVEVGSSVAAESVVGVCLTEKCVLDVGFFLEGAKRVLGCVRISGVDLSLAEPLLRAPSLHVHTGTVPGAIPPSSLPHFDVPSPGERRSRGNNTGSSVSAMPLCNSQFEDTWEGCDSEHGFKVRGPGYMSGGGKVDAGKPFGKLVRVDLFKMEPGVDRMDNIGSVGRAGKVVRHLQKAGEFLVIVNLQVPGNPPLSLVFYYAVPVPPGGEPQPGAGGRSEGFLDLFRRFVDLGPLNNAEEGDAGAFEEEGLGEAGGGGRLPGDDLRNLRFKLFPSILAGPWIVRKAVGSKPTLIAQKLTCRYFRTKSYFEVDIDIGSSVVAYNTVSLAIGYAKSLVVDLGFCVQGEKENELPEVLLGVARIRKLDVLLADPLEASADDEDSEDSDEEPLGEEEGGAEAGEGVVRVAPEDREGAAGGLDGERGADVTMVPSLFVAPTGAMALGTFSPLTSSGLEGMFSDSGETHGLRVRGPSYARDGRKISAGPAFGSLLRADLFRVDGNRHHLFRVDDICSHGRMRERVSSLLSVPNPPFLFVVNIQMPGDRAHSMVLCWGLCLREAEAAAAAGKLSQEDGNFLRLLRRYINLDLEGGLPMNDIRNRRLKMFPKILEGPWVVRKAVGKPCVIGRRLTARFFRRPDYFEVDIDVGSSALASNATHLAGGYAKHIVLDLAFGLQGESEDELPERLIGSARIVRPDLGRAEPLND